MLWPDLDLRICMHLTASPAPGVVLPAGKPVTGVLKNSDTTADSEHSGRQIQTAIGKVTTAATGLQLRP